MGPCVGGDLMTLVKGVLYALRLVLVINATSLATPLDGVNIAFDNVRVKYTQLWPSVQGVPVSGRQQSLMRLKTY